MLSVEWAYIRFSCLMVVVIDDCCMVVGPVLGSSLLANYYARIFIRKMFALLY